MHKRLTRRRFVRMAAFAGLGAALEACGKAVAPTASPTAGCESGSEACALPSPTGSVAPEATATAFLPPTDTPTPEPSDTSRPDPTDTPTPTATDTPVPPSPTPSSTSAPLAYLAVAHGSDPNAITRAAIAAIGGMERFVKVGYRVIVKPNICADYRTYTYAATTNPEVVAALVELCLEAGARSVTVMDTPIMGSAVRAYDRSGIGKAVEAAGGITEVMNDAKFRSTPIPEGKSIRSWSVYQPILDADLVINVPIAKHHSLTRLTLGCKNLMGIVQNRGGLHPNIAQRIADLTSLIRPKLTVVDAVRMLMDHGPTGGSLDDVRLANTVIASPDIVAADAYAATLFNLSGSDIGYIKAAADMGLGTLDLKSIRIEEMNL